MTAPKPRATPAEAGGRVNKANKAGGRVNKAGDRVRAAGRGKDGDAKVASRSTRSLS